MTNSPKSTSKLLSLVLRHQPEKIGICLDAHGWVDVELLLNRLNATGHRVDRALLEEVVATSDKQRFAFSPDRSQIRANQGHSVAVDLALPTTIPPPVLYHGTALLNLPSIKTSGLVAGSRHDVHLSVNTDTAKRVGERHGRPVVLKVDAARMHADGHKFQISANGVWLVAAVPQAYIEVLSEGS